MNKNSIFYKFAKRLERPDSSFDRLLNEIFCICVIQYGKVKYRRLKKKCGDKIKLFNCSNDAGDLLYFSKYKHKFMEVHNINEDETVFICLNNNVKVANTVGIKNPIGVSRLDVFSISMAHRFKGREVIEIYNVFPWIIFDDENFKTKIQPTFPKYNYDENSIRELFAKEGLEVGNTVVLAPYEQAISAEGLSVLSTIFWEKLAKKLREQGYSVCTNCKGDDVEPPIEGTSVFFPKFSESEAAVTLAGHLIAIRSGFVDFVCNAQAKIEVLYPTKGFHDVFNIRLYGDNSNYNEIIYENTCEDELIEYLLKEIIGEIK